MSGRLNKLVQPECGAPNPLVSAARQIATGPTHRFQTGPPPAGLVQQQRQQLNFAKEFAQREPPPLNVGQVSHGATTFHQEHPQASSSSRVQQQQQPQLNMMNHHMPPPQTTAHFGVHHQSQHQHRAAASSSSSISAGEQLETKYRNDMISASQQSTSPPGKLDDVEFWQSLSQSYMGPPTFSNIPTLHEETEYAFDERNPLKDQYENPFEEGLKRLEQGDIPSAALLFEAAVQREPENALAWRYLGTTQAQNEMDKSAIRALRICLRLEPSDQEARMAIAVSLVNETQHREACRHLLEWLTKHERYGAIEASIEHFDRLDAELASEGSADDPFLMNPLASLDKHQEYVSARFVEAARMAPNNPDPEVQNALGVLFNMRGEYTKAVDCFKAALSVRQQDSLLWNRLGATLANGNKSDEAVIAYRRALEISPGFLRSRYNLAISLIHLNLYDEAAKQLIQILNTQAAGQGGQVRTRSITSTSIWNTLRTVATLMNKPDLYPIIDGRDLSKCNELLIRSS